MISWYIWAILGVLSIVFEMISPTFFALFIGVGFLCSALVSFFFPDALIMQIVFALIGMFVGLWIFRRRKLADSPVCKTGQTDEFLGLKGKVIKESTSEQRAEAVFDGPIFGKHQWLISSSTNVGYTPNNSGYEVVASDEFALNDLVEVVAVFSNHLSVKKISN